MKKIYLDYASSTPVDPRVAEAMWPYLTEIFGNPASEHVFGYEAKAAVEKARLEVSQLIEGEPKGIIWTSGATEANNLAIRGAAHFYQRQGKHLITGITEHSSVLECFKYLERQGFEVTYLTPDATGLFSVERIAEAIRPDTLLISLMHVNNEIGVIQPISAISALAHKRGILLHVDAAQSAGKTPIQCQTWGVDLLSLSAHKLYGPKGIGALYISQSPRIRLEPLLLGGGHEKGLRSGTVPTHQVVGMGMACQLAHQEMSTESLRLLSLRTQLWEGLRVIKDSQVNGDLKNRIPGNLNISFKDVSGELLHRSLPDLAISSQATCEMIKHHPSHVLKALGCGPEWIEGTLRITIGRFTTESDILYAIERIQEVISQLRQ